MLKDDAKWHARCFATLHKGGRGGQAALDRLDEIFPGPGGAAPNAYAW